MIGNLYPRKGKNILPTAEGSPIPRKGKYPGRANMRGGHNRKTQKVQAQEIGSQEVPGDGHL